MSVLVNLKQLDLTTHDVETIISYLYIDLNSNTKLIQKMARLQEYVKRDEK